MKGKMKVLFAALATAVCFTGAVACDEPTPEPPAHEHTYAETLTHDDTHHWYAATCEHTDEVKDKAEHTLTEKVVTAATYKAAGKAKKTCACGYETAEYDIAKIAQVTPECTLPTGLTAYKGETLADITLPEGWAFVDALTTLVGNEGNNEFAVKYTAPNDTEGKYLTVDGTVTVAVSKARPAYTVPTGLAATYGDTLADITLPTAANGAWSWKVADTTAVGNAGTNEFVLVFTPDDTDTYATVEVTVTVAVAKANYTGYTLPTGLTATYGDTLASVSLGEGWAFVDALATTVGNAGTNDFAVTYTPENTNYNIVTGLTVSVAVAKATPAYTVPTGLTATYGDTLGDINITAFEGWSWKDTTATKVGDKGSRVFKMTYTPSDTANYNTVENIEVTVEVAAKALTTAAVGAIAAQTYTGELITPELTVADGATALTKDTDYTVVFDDNENAGTASAVVTFTGNYTGVADLTFTINPAALTAEMITVNAGTQKTNGVTELATAVVFNGSTVTDDFTVAYSNTLYAGAGKATVTAKASTNFTGTVEKDYTIGQYAGATAKVMNASVDALDNYAGETIEITSTGENDNRGVWYKAEMKEDGMYIVAKAVADYYVADTRFETVANGITAQPNRHTYFDIKVNGGKHIIYRAGATAAEAITRISGGASPFDFVIWNTVENTGVVSGGKYTHVMEAFIPKAKLTSEYISIAYSSGFKHADSVDPFDTTTLASGHIEVADGYSNSFMSEGYWYYNMFNTQSNENRLFVGTNGLAVGSEFYDMGSKTDPGTATDGGAKEANAFKWANTKSNFVTVFEYNWDMSELTYTNNEGTWSGTGTNLALAMTFKMSGSQSLMLNVDFKTTGAFPNPLLLSGVTTKREGYDNAYEMAVKSKELFAAGKWKAVVVRNGSTVDLYAPLSADGSLVWVASNPIDAAAEYKGFIFRLKVHEKPLTVTAKSYRGTTDVAHILSYYYGEDYTYSSADQKYTPVAND